MAGLELSHQHRLAMYSSPPKSWTLPLMILVAISGHAAPAFSENNVQLSVVPDRCISLLRGQTCYQGVRFLWNVQDTDVTNVNKTICLWREGDSVALTCWEGELEGVYRYSLEAAKTTNFHLVSGSEQQPIIGSTKVTISWVYNKRGSRSSRWRLF